MAPIRWPRPRSTWPSRVSRALRRQTGERNDQQGRAGPSSASSCAPRSRTEPRRLITVPWVVQSFACPQSTTGNAKSSAYTTGSKATSLAAALKTDQLRPITGESRPAMSKVGNARADGDQHQRNGAEPPKLPAIANRQAQEHGPEACAAPDILRGSASALALDQKTSRMPIASLPAIATRRGVSSCGAESTTPAPPTATLCGHRHPTRARCRHSRGPRHQPPPALAGPPPGRRARRRLGAQRGKAQILHARLHLDLELTGNGRLVQPDFSLGPCRRHSATSLAPSSRW